MDEFHIFLENTVISTLGKRLSCRHQSRKEKREESSEEGEAKRHKVLDDRDADKIKEDRRELNKKRESVLKDWLENLNQRTIHQLCYKECWRTIFLWKMSCRDLFSR